MENEFQELRKLASEAIATVEQLEGENAELRNQLSKQAAVVAKPSVSEEAAGKAVDSLFKSGLITEDQKDLTKRAFTEDPEAALRAIPGILDAQRQVKTASTANISGGQLLNGSASEVETDDVFDRMQRILGMNR